MNRTRRFAGPTDVALLWLASLVTLGAGWYVAFAVLGASIDLQHRLTARVSATMVANAETLAQRPALAHMERSITDRLHDLGFDADKPTAVARFIHAATQIAEQHAVSVVQIDGHDSARADPSPAMGVSQASGGAFAIDIIPLDVTLRGSYSALLATIRDFARAPLIMQIDIAAIERDAVTPGTHAGGPLIARLHIDLERVVAGERLMRATTQPPAEDTPTHARPL